MQNFFITQIGKKSYDYSNYATILGEDFLGAACDAVRIRKSGNIKLATWERKYVNQFDLFVKLLTTYLTKVSVDRSHNVSEFTVTEWEKFANYFAADLKSKNIAQATLKSHVIEINDLLFLFEAKRVIPVKITINIFGGVTVYRATFKVDQRFFVHKNKHKTYEYSNAAEVLGAAFVAGACEVVRKQKTDANVNERTWLDNYVVRLSCLFDALVEYIGDNSDDCPLLAADFSNEHWKSFSIWYRVRLLNEPLLETTKSKHIHCSNKLFSLLSRADVISTRIEMEGPSERKQKKDGQSTFTQKGWAKKEKKELPSSPLRFYVSGQRWYDYTPYQPIARTFLMVIAPILKKLYLKYSAGRAKNLYNHFISFLNYLIDKKECGEWPEFFALLNTDEFKKISLREWEDAVYGWRESLTNGRRKLSTSHLMVGSFRVVWAELVTKRVVPYVKINGFKNARKRGQSKKRRSLAQLTKHSKVAKVLDEVYEKLERFFDDIEKPEVLEYIAALCSELSTQEIKAFSVADMTEKIFLINNTRLQELRKCAESEFLFWYEHWERGQAALASVQYSEEQILYMLDSPILSASERRNNSATLLFNGPEETRLGNALLYVIASVKGTATGLHGRYHHMMRSLGGRFIFHAYLHPHSHATHALWVMLMIDTGANCEVVREMPYSCISASKSPGKWDVKFALKGRADGKAIEDELDEKPKDEQRLSSAIAIQHYQKMVLRYRLIAENDSKNKLFLHDYSNSIHGLEEFTARAWFKEFLGRHTETLGWDALPSQIRVSHLMVAQHNNAHHVVAAQALADHSNPVTTLNSYTGGVPTILQYNLKLREFQERFQSVMIVSIKDAAGKLGLTEDELRKIFSDAARTGLGVACLNPLAGVQPGTKAGQQCTNLDACCGCDMRWVVATVENVADLILFHEYLKVQESVESQNNPEGWEKRWLPWLVFSDIALTKLREGDTAKVYAEAEAKAAERRVNYKPFPLF